MKSFRPLLCAAVCVAALVPGGCSQYLDRKDTVAFGAGDAVHTNMLAHVVDPWPARAWNRRILVDGERMQRAIERYRTGRVATPRAVPGAAGAAATAEPPDAARTR